MKKKFLVKMFSVFAILSLVNSLNVLAKVKTKDVKQQKEQQPKEQPKEQQLKEQPKEQSKKQQQEKKLSLEEEKQKQEDIKTIKEVLNRFKSLEEKTQEKLKNMFKDFKKEAFEVKNYDLEVFFKNNAPILVYTHKKTGAQVYFNLYLDKIMAKNNKNKLIFKTFTKNNYGLIHFSKNCIAKPFLDYFIKKLNVSPDDLFINELGENFSFNLIAAVTNFNENLEKEYVEKLSCELINPSVFKKGDSTFEVVKKRLLNEAKDSKFGEYYQLDWQKVDSLRNFNSLGELLEMKKVTLKDLKNFYEEYIHPSNCLLIKNVFELKPNYIKNYLNLWHENYFKHYNKKQIKSNNSELKNKEKYLFNSWPKDSDVFVAMDYEKNKKQSFKYKANVRFNEKILKEKQKETFKLNSNFLKKDLKLFIKNLGYEEVYLNFWSLHFYGNKKECFTKKALEENSKKIMDFVAEKLKGLKEEDFLYSRYYNFKNYKEPEIKNLNEQYTYLWSQPNVYKGEPIFYLVEDSFRETKKAISDKNFVIKKGNEIESSYELTEKNIKENLKGSLNVYKVFAKNGPEQIDVFEKNNKKTLKQMFEKEKEKYEITPRVLPIKFKEKNSKKFVKDFAILLLAKFLNEELKEKRGLVYDDLKASFCLEDDFLIKYFLNKESVKELEDFLVKNFKKIMKNFKATKKDLNEFKKQFKQNFSFFKFDYGDILKKEKKLTKDLKNYLKTGKADEKSFLEGENFKVKDFYRLFPNHLLFEVNEFLFTFFEDFKDYEAFLKKGMAFKEKYIKNFNEKVNSEFVKDFLENILNPTMKKLKKAFKLTKEKLKALDYIKISDVKNLVKTAYLVEDKEQVKKVNKNILKKIKKDKDFSNKTSSNYF